MILEFFSAVWKRNSELKQTSKQNVRKIDTSKTLLI